MKNNEFMQQVERIEAIPYMYRMLLCDDAHGLCLGFIDSDPCSALICLLVYALRCVHAPACAQSLDAARRGGISEVGLHRRTEARKRRHRPRLR